MNLKNISGYKYEQAPILHQSPVRIPETKVTYQPVVASTEENHRAAQASKIALKNMNGAQFCSLLSCVGTFIGICFLISCASNGCFDATHPSPDTCDTTCMLGSGIALTVVGSIIMAISCIYCCAHDTKS